MKPNRKAAFLDRDGVVIEDVGHLSRVGDVHLLPGAAAAIKQLNDSGYHVILITNQGAIAKGLLTHEALALIHDEMNGRLAREGAHIDRIYYCPHHPAGTIAEYSVICECRKPNTKMIKDAIDEFNIDIDKSFLVGDKSSDILAGSRMGLRTVLISGTPDALDVETDSIPDFTAGDLAAAIKYFL